MKRIEQMSLWERLYFPEVIRGLMVTGARFWRNLAIHSLQKFGLAKDSNASITVQYPEEKWTYPETYRGRHRLTLKPDDTVQCTACYLCATACPAECIYIEAGEYADKPVEKFPIRYEIDTLRCIYCGYCEEVCPEEAIVMSNKYELAFLNAEDAVFGKDRLLTPVAQLRPRLEYLRAHR